MISVRRGRAARYVYACSIVAVLQNATRFNLLAFSVVANTNFLSLTETNDGIHVQYAAWSHPQAQLQRSFSVLR